MVKVYRVSVLSGKLNSMVLPVAEEDYDYCVTRWHNGMLIQEAFPMLDRNQREFIKNGITPDEFNILENEGLYA
jgi:hypothetical protein